MLYNFSWVIPNMLAGSNMPGRSVIGKYIPIHTIDINKDLMELRDTHQINTLVSVVDVLPVKINEQCQSLCIEHLFAPCEDYSIPNNIKLFYDVVDVILKRIKDNKRVCVHCLAGIGRTGLTLACVLGKYYNLDGVDAIFQLRKVRPNSVENDEQCQFIYNFLK